MRWEIPPEDARRLRDLARSAGLGDAEFRTEFAEGRDMPFRIDVGRFHGTGVTHVDAIRALERMLRRAIAEGAS